MLRCVFPRLRVCVFVGLALAAAACAPRAAAGQAWVKSELYFGMNRPGGAVVTAEQWAAFVDGEVTPRFPAGLTVLDGVGQYRGDDGVIQRESSRVLVVLYPASNSAEADTLLRALARAYARAFEQESVLRVDAPVAVDFITAAPAGAASPAASSQDQHHDALPAPTR